jgi:hypothetical protein
VSEALSSIIGARGVEALHRRSVFLARAQHGWLPEPAADQSMADSVNAMLEAYSAHSAAEAVSAQTALLQTFNDLLENLIGSSLTDRLLEPVWQSPPPASGAEDDVP